MTTTPLEIRFRGACRTPDEVYGYDLHFPHGETEACAAQIERAKQVCGGCPVQFECRKWALTHAEHGIWGGLTEEERRQTRETTLRRRVKQAATPAAASAEPAAAEAVA